MLNPVALGCVMQGFVSATKAAKYDASTGVPPAVTLLLRTTLWFTKLSARTAQKPMCESLLKRIGLALGARASRKAPEGLLVNEKGIRGPCAIAPDTEGYVVHEYVLTFTATPSPAVKALTEQMMEQEALGDTWNVSAPVAHAKRAALSRLEVGHPAPDIAMELPFCEK